MDPSTGNGNTAGEATADARASMVARQIEGRGIAGEAVLQALREVPREVFLPLELKHLAYSDQPLPIGRGQTISQPYIVALMAEAAELGADDRVLEVGTGSGYAAAVFSRIAGRVHTVERHGPLADEAEARLRELGYENVEVAVRDGTLGWPEHAPYDAIIVAAASPGTVPAPLLEQLAPGGRLVIPRGSTRAGQELVRIRRTSEGEYDEEPLGLVRFVPLIGEAGWTPEPGEEAEPERARAARASAGKEGAGTGRAAAPGPTATPSLPFSAPLHDRVAASAEAFDDLESADLGPLVDRIRDARLVLIGEASHGTSEFYRMRARISRKLIEEHDFDFVAVEADWPDAAEIDAYVRHDTEGRPHRKPFQRFPRWMWANEEVMEFVHWLRRFNGHGETDDPSRLTGFHGLDLYSMHASIEAVLHYLDDVDPEAAAVARDRYACLSPWQNDPVLYGRAVLSGSFDKCEGEVLKMLRDLMDKRIQYLSRDGNRFADAVQNARLVANAERYYRVMYRGSVSSWNLRDQHMFDTLEMLLDLYGPGSRGIVWAHNSHLGDASATAMGDRGEHNVGQLVREAYEHDARLVGFGTHTGTVAAAHDWGEPMEVMDVQPSHPESYEHLAHASEVPNFVLTLRDPADARLREQLLERRLERAIGVIYRPATELQSHYFPASLPRQFDEWIWLDRSTALTPIGEAHREQLAAMPETFPFGV